MIRNFLRLGLDFLEGAGRSRCSPKCEVGSEDKSFNTELTEERAQRALRVRMLTKSGL